MPLVYLAGAIDRATESPARWVKEIKDDLISVASLRSMNKAIEPLVIYSPFLAFEGSIEPYTKDSALRVSAINMRAVIMSNLVLTHYEPGVETWGTPMEVLQAFLEDVPVIVWAESVKSRVPPYLKACADDIISVGSRAAAETAIDLLYPETVNGEEI